MIATTAVQYTPNANTNTNRDPALYRPVDSCHHPTGGNLSQDQLDAIRTHLKAMRGANPPG